MSFREVRKKRRANSLWLRSNLAKQRPINTTNGLTN